MIFFHQAQLVNLCLSCCFTQSNILNWGSAFPPLSVFTCTTGIALPSNLVFTYLHSRTCKKEGKTWKKQNQCFVHSTGQMYWRYTVQTPLVAGLKHLVYPFQILPLWWHLQVWAQGLKPHTSCWHPALLTHTNPYSHIQSHTQSAGQHSLVFARDHIDMHTLSCSSFWHHVFSCWSEPSFWHLYTHRYAKRSPSPRKMVRHGV